VINLSSTPKKFKINALWKESFSPILFASLLIKPLPKAPLNLVLKYLTDQMQQNHPSVIERLSVIAGTRFLICPTDFTFNILLTVFDGHVECKVSDVAEDIADVKISGTLLCLIDMLNGDVDGDALFFSRDLTVEGDTEALLVLRNSMDSVDVNLREEFLSSMGAAKAPAGKILKLSGKIFNYFAEDMNIIRQALLDP
jgi:predicted lipid carrier protein YhbT